MMKNILILIITLTSFYGMAQKKVGYFGKKNFFSVGINPTIDFKIGELLGVPRYIDGNEVKQQGLFTFRLGGVNVGYSRALSNRFLMGANFRISKFRLYSPTAFNSVDVFTPIDMGRTQVGLHLEFSSFEWNSLIMGNFMNRFEIGVENVSLPQSGELWYISIYDVDVDSKLDSSSPVTIFDLDNLYEQPKDYSNNGFYVRYAAMQAIPLSETFVLRFGFDATFHASYMALFRDSYDLNGLSIPEYNYVGTMSNFKLMAFRSVVNFRTELVIAL